MPLINIEPYWRAGTVTVAANSKAVTGAGTNWLANVMPGDQFFGADGRMAVVDTVNSNTSITLLENWPGAAQTAGKYTIYRISDSVRVENFRQRSLNLLETGNVSSLANLALAADKLLAAGGAGTLELADFPSWARALFAETGQLPNARVRNDLAPDKAFRRGTVLGAVSQASGVPTGAIIERGSNANGEFVRFADGTQICSTILTLTVAITTSYEFFYFGTHLWTYPAAFSGTAAVLSGTARNTSGGSMYFVLSGNRAAGATVNDEVWIVSPNSRTAEVVLRCVAIGRWF